MIQFIHVIDVFLPLVYAISLGTYLSFFLVKNPTLGRFASHFLFLGILVHIIFLGSKWAYFGYFPIASSFASLSMLALAIGIVYYIVEKIVKEGRTGIFFLSIIFVFQLISSMFIKYNQIPNQLLSDPKFGVHTTFTLLGISALAISALYGLMYIMLVKEIKSRHFGVIYDGLPSLEILEKMGRYSTVVGIVVLGIGILLGHLWAYKVLGYFFKFDPKIVITDIAWLAYVGGWIIVWKKRWYGLRGSMITFWGFLVFFTSMVFVNFIYKGFHKFM